MSIFRKKSNKTSNDYYNSYKAELGIEESNNGFFSLRTIVKIETATIVAGIIFMGYSNFFSDFAKNYSIKFNTNALMSHVIDSTSISDSELVLQLQESEPEIFTRLEITEDESGIDAPVGVLAKKLNMNFADLSLIVEIIKSEMTPKSISKNEDSIVIGQL